MRKTFSVLTISFLLPQIAIGGTPAPTTFPLELPVTARCRFLTPTASCPSAARAPHGAVFFDPRDPHNAVRVARHAVVSGGLSSALNAQDAAAIVVTALHQIRLAVRNESIGGSRREIAAALFENLSPTPVERRLSRFPHSPLNSPKRGIRFLPVAADAVLTFTNLPQGYWFLDALWGTAEIQPRSPSVGPGATPSSQMLKAVSNAIAGIESAVPNAGLPGASSSWGEFSFAPLRTLFYRLEDNRLLEAVRVLPDTNLSVPVRKSLGQRVTGNDLVIKAALTVLARQCAGFTRNIAWDNHAVSTVAQLVIETEELSAGLGRLVDELHKDITIFRGTDVYSKEREREIRFFISLYRVAAKEFAAQGGECSATQLARAVREQLGPDSSAATFGP